MGDGLARSYLTANAHLFSAYRCGFVRDTETNVGLSIVLVLI